MKTELMKVSVNKPNRTAPENQPVWTTCGNLVNLSPLSPHLPLPISKIPRVISHRLIKAKLKDDRDALDYLLKKYRASVAVRVSELERVSYQADWDFRDSKLARWAKKREGQTFKA